MFLTLHHWISSDVQHNEIVLWTIPSIYNQSNDRAYKNASDVQHNENVTWTILQHTIKEITELVKLIEGNLINSAIRKSILRELRHTINTIQIAFTGSKKGVQTRQWGPSNASFTHAVEELQNLNFKCIHHKIDHTVIKPRSSETICIFPKSWCLFSSVLWSIYTKILQKLEML